MEACIGCARAHAHFACPSPCMSDASCSKGNPPFLLRRFPVAKTPAVFAEVYCRKGAARVSLAAATKSNPIFGGADKDGDGRGGGAGHAERSAREGGAGDKQAAVQAYVTELNRTLPLYKRIVAVHLAEGPLPRNAAGKLQRK